MYGLAILSDSQLMEVYKQAIEINLDQDFINILAAELNKRELDDLSLLKRNTLFDTNFPYPLHG
jgi:Sporulation inhibitor A